VTVTYATDDHDPASRTATRFDDVFDKPNVAGGVFSFFRREALYFADRHGLWGGTISG
jgi:hypothetical protein